jgi:DNA-binding NtrC family response regulator
MSNAATAGCDIPLEGAESHTEASVVATGIVGRSKSHLSLLRTLQRVAQSTAEILITGPTGVGKELYAHYAHTSSRRRERPFIAVNCSNLSGELLENELFGHARGAYTGAQTTAGGMAAAAEGGTLFFDEIDTLTASCQSKLLRFIQTKEYRPLGGTHVVHADIRFIAATNADLAEMVRVGRFREDLFYRLRVVPLQVPPLAERPDDITPLLEHFAAMYGDEYTVPPVVFGEAARAFLLRYPWPGNVRELENCVRFLTCMQLGRTIEVDDLPLRFGGQGAGGESDITDVPLKLAKEQLIEEFEKLYLERALERSKGNVSAAARASGKHRRAFFELLRKYGLEASAYRD